MASHVPNEEEQMAKYYRYYSNVSRGKRKNGYSEGLIPSMPEAEECSREYKGVQAKLGWSYPRDLGGRPLTAPIVPET